MDGWIEMGGWELKISDQILIKEHPPNSEVRGTAEIEGMQKRGVKQKVLHRAVPQQLTG